ncbi:MAG: 4-hydroxythreonine-4-phosphate dehydrogenase PdxA [Nitrososphaerota archaeon]|jgi:4-hydroxythreonine-4-phosphate dehydrogenase|nr:4-hydroxythreonine-4-phosphate dehydrogenase PdxA [Nitrososphaerota archaeon]MDG6955289.1 4-hydroxythreonine-4-phosphate dehydrogenase PdxA [Nitrososphaerota archaeon]
MRIGITLGDPAGVGPEIVAKSLGRFREDHLVLIGAEDSLSRASEASSLKNSLGRNVSVVDVGPARVSFGAVQRRAGVIALRSIKKGVEMALKGEVDALVTAPINKEAIVLAGSKHIDHTTMLGALAGAREVSTVFETKKLRVYFMTKHVSLVEACKEVKEEKVYEAILVADRCLQLLGSKRRKVAVAALNPHGGEGGLLGNEEKEEIQPAIERAKGKADVMGPYPADSVFYRGSRGEFDIVVALYHDQGHIAAKMHSFARTVSMNLGLPFLRTSVDHGTAFDIAGKGIADETSMVEAIAKAKEYGLVYKERYRLIYGAKD